MAIYPTWQIKFVSTALHQVTTLSLFCELLLRSMEPRSLHLDYWIQFGSSMRRQHLPYHVVHISTPKNVQTTTISADQSTLIIIFQQLRMCCSMRATFGSRFKMSVATWIKAVRSVLIIAIKWNIEERTNQNNLEIKKMACNVYQYIRTCLVPLLFKSCSHIIFSHLFHQKNYCICSSESHQTMISKWWW